MVGKKLLITSMFLLLMCGLRAQSIGVALSGGGAKGMYHIGILKALEENDVPIDYISGTSAGAIVGGLYAIGMTPAQMEEIFCSDIVKVWMSGQVEDKYSFYFKNSRKTATAFSLPLDFKSDGSGGGFKFPSSLISSFQIDMAFVEYFASADIASQKNFDNLFIPFRCTATDAINREGYMFREGNLGRAVRASMSIPMVFRPMREDSVLLYDGGMYNNFPWQVLKDDFDADIIIGSQCTEGNSVATEDDLVEQIFAMMMLNTDYSLPDSSVLIKRAVNTSTLDFSRAREIIHQGYHDAMYNMPEILATVGDRRVSKNERARKRMEFISTLPGLEFGKIEIEGLTPSQVEYVNNMMKLYPSERSGKPQTFSYEKFKSEYSKLLSSDDFEVEYPTVVYDTITDLFNIKLSLKAKPGFKIKVGGNISSTALNQAYIGLEYKRVNRMANLYYLDSYISPMYTSVQLGSTSDFIMRVPVSMNYSMNYNYYNYFRSNYGILSKGSDLSYSKSNDLFFSFSLSTPLSRTSLLMLRSHLGQDEYNYFQETNLYSDNDILDYSKLQYIGLELMYDRDIRNYYLFPTRGVSQQISGIYMVGNEKFEPGTSALYGEKSSEHTHDWFGARFTREQYYNPAGWLSLGYYIDGVITTYKDMDNDYISNLTMPAFQPTQHSKFIYMKEFRSDMFIATGVIPSFIFSDKLYLRTEIYAYLPNNINKTQEGIKQRLRYIYSGSLVYQTIIGPVSLSLSKYDLSRETTGVSNNWFLAFNFGYTIFNQKGLFY